MLNNELIKFSKQHEDESELAVMEMFSAKKSSPDGYLVNGNGEASNTYNWQSCIDQVLQFCVIHTKVFDESKYFLVLQIHNGCDVRGGYTDPTIFELEDGEEFFMNIDRVNAWCGCDEDSNWECDSCGYWYPDIKTAWDFDAKNQKVTCKKCGKEIRFSCGTLSTPIKKEEVITNA